MRALLSEYAVLHPVTTLDHRFAHHIGGIDFIDDARHLLRTHSHHNVALEIFVRLLRVQLFDLVQFALPVRRDGVDLAQDVRVALRRAPERARIAPK